MRSTVLLTIDAVINLLLGILLILFPKGLVTFLGAPVVENSFYTAILVHRPLWFYYKYTIRLRCFHRLGSDFIGACGSAGCIL